VKDRNPWLWDLKGEWWEILEKWFRVRIIFFCCLHFIHSHIRGWYIASQGTVDITGKITKFDNCILLNIFVFWVNCIQPTRFLSTQPRIAVAWERGPRKI
jgi:hypothetical protein